MLKIDRGAIEALPADRQDEARALLLSLEEGLKSNPLQGYEPHAKQITFHSSSQRIKGFMGGNRSGKTTAGILDDLIQAVDRDCVPERLLQYKRWNPPFYCRIVVPGFDMLEGVTFQKLREWAPKDQLVGGRFDKAYEKANRVLRFKNGSWFDFRTFEQDVDKFVGAALHRIHYDEEPPFAIRQSSKMRLADYRGEEVFTMTPEKGMTWMYDTIYEPWIKGRLTNGDLVIVDIEDNPHISKEGVREALEGYSREELEAHKSGRFVHFAGMIYDEFSRNFHVIPEQPIPAKTRVYVGIDPGMRHMAAVVWCYLTPEDTLVVFDELALQGHTVAQVAEAIKLINLKHGKDGIPLTPDWYVIDPSARNIVHQTGRSDQMEFTDHGIVTILGQNSVTAGINRVKERLQANRLLVMANCQTLIDQFRKYRWATPTRTEDDAKEKPVKTDDHLLDALRYVVQSRPYSPQQEAEAESLSPFERAIKRDMNKTKSAIPKTPMGAVFA
jgi:phage terminase large subunit-like protein